MPLEKPHRLMLPSPDARSARSPFEPDDTNFADGSPASDKVVFVPIVQWGQIRIRGRISGNAGAMEFQFVRPNRALEPSVLPVLAIALVYVEDQPAIENSVWVDGVEFSLEITAAEHQGENWLKITLDPDGAGDIDFFDISGVNLGLH